MTSERSQAYGRVMKTIEDLGPTKLLAPERDTLREAADALLFCEDIGADPHAELALAEAQQLGRHLVESGRWLGETADALVRDLQGTGPLAPVAS